MYNRRVITGVQDEYIQVRNSLQASEIHSLCQLALQGERVSLAGHLML